MGEVVGLPGVTRPDLPAGAQPRASVVEMLEALVEQARRGEIQGIGIAVAGSDNSVTYDWEFSDVGTRHQLFAAISDLFHEFAAMRAGARRSETWPDASA